MLYTLRHIYIIIYNIYIYISQVHFVNGIYLFGGFSLSSINNFFKIHKQSIISNNLYLLCNIKFKQGERCPELSVDNGEVKKTGSEVGSQVRYVCDKGFTLVGAPVRECQEDFTWSGKDGACQGMIIRQYQYLK